MRVAQPGHFRPKAHQDLKTLGFPLVFFVPTPCICSRLPILLIFVFWSFHLSFFLFFLRSDPWPYLFFSQAHHTHERTQPHQPEPPVALFLAFFRLTIAVRPPCLSSAGAMATPSSSQASCAAPTSSRRRQAAAPALSSTSHL